MNKHVVISLFVLAAAGTSCSTVHVTKVQPGRGGELAVQEGLFGEPAQVKADRVMQGQCPEGYEVEQDAEVVVGSITTTQSETEGKVKRDKVATSTSTVSETRDKTERRITWRCKGVTPAAAAATALPAAPATTYAVPTASLLDQKKPTGWTADIGMGRRWYKPEDTTVSNFHSTNLDIRLLYEVLPGFEFGGDMHVDGYGNDTAADNEDFTSSLFEFGLTTKLSHSFGAIKPYLVGNYYFFGEGNREYERTIGFATEKYVGRNSSRGIDGALGVAWNLGEASLYFEWYRSAQREMTVKGRLEKQVLYPNGALSASSEGDKRSFKTHYDGFALGLSLPIKN